jgi:hypothetical protein
MINMQRICDLLNAVKTEKGTIIRRNRRDLLSTPERYDLRDAADDEMEIPPNPLAVQLPRNNNKNNNNNTDLQQC